MNEDPHIILLHASEELHLLAKSLRITGNTILAEKLDFLGKEVYNANKAIRHEIAEELNERIVSAEQSTANMINACLSGIKLANNELEKKS